MSNKQNKHEGARERLWSPVFLAIIACTLCAFLVGQGSNAGTSVYLDRIGGSVGLAGIGALTFSAAAAVARIVGGPVIDLRGRDLVMVVGSVVMICGTVGPLWVNDGLFFIVWRTLQGLGFAAVTTASATAAADVLPFSRLGEGIGYYGLGQAISMSIGPALAIFLVSTDPAGNFYFGLTACAVLALVFACMIRYEKHPGRLPETSAYRMRFEESQEGVSRSFDSGRCAPSAQDDAKEETRQVRHSERKAEGLESKNLANNREKQAGILDSVFEPTALPGTIPMMFIATSFGFGIFYMGLCGGALGAGNAGLFYTISAVSMIAVRLTSSKFMDKVLPFRIMAAAVVCGLLCYGTLLLCTVLEPGVAEILFYVSGIPYGLSLGVALPVNQTVAVRLSPSERWGAANGLFLLGNDVSIGLASLLWGFIIESFGFQIAIILVMCFITASLAAAWICYPESDKRKVDQ